MRTHGKNREFACESLFVDNQIEKCVEFAKRSGYNVVAVFREEGESGRTTDRTEFKKMLEYCYDKKNNVFAMISYKLDRFTRNAGGYAYLVKAFKKNIEVIFSDGIKTDTSVGKLMKTIEAGFAEFESDRIGERINDGNHKARRSGRYTFPRVILFRFKENLKQKNLKKRSSSKIIRYSR